MKIRQSMIGTADICLRRLQYDVEAPPDTYHSGIVRAVGTAYHAGHENQYLRRMERGEMAPDLNQIRAAAHSSLHAELEKAGEQFVWDDKFPTLGDAIETLDSMLFAYYAHPDAYWNADWEVLGIEVPFELSVPGNDQDVRSGTIDLVMRHRDTGGIVVDDHKTAGRKWPAGKHDPRKHPQPPFYVGAAWELWPDAPSIQFSFSVMTYKGDFERRVSPVTPAHMAAVQERGQQIAALYRGMRANGLELPANPTSTLCNPKWCDHWSYCPFGAALEQN